MATKKPEKPEKKQPPQQQKPVLEMSDAEYRKAYRDGKRLERLATGETKEDDWVTWQSLTPEARSVIMAQVRESLPPGQCFTYRVNVKRVVSGDTVILDIDLGFGLLLERRRIRLWGIDCAQPPRGKASGKTAKDRLMELIIPAAEAGELELRTVRVGLAQEDMDHLGRYVGVLFHRGNSINDTLVREGFALPYPAGFVAEPRRVMRDRDGGFIAQDAKGQPTGYIDIARRAAEFGDEDDQVVHPI